MAPLVSVVMPCFNAGRMLRPALRSVIEQTYPNIEIVFVDNNSTDGSLERAREAAAQSPRPVTVLTCAEQGANHARIRGYGEIRGDYVQWFDADDLLAPDKIERQVAFLEQHEDVSIAYCDWLSRRFAGVGRPLEQRIVLSDVADQILRTLAQVWYPPNVYLLRRAAADRLQAEAAWWPSRPVGTDVEYSAVAALLGLAFRHVPHAAAAYNVWSDAQLSGTATPYPLRAGILAAIFRRLATLARRPDIAPRVTARHRVLLEQDWNVWVLPRDSVALTRPGVRSVQLAHRASGRSLALRPRETRVVEALLKLPTPQTLSHHALEIAQRVPALGSNVPFIVETLERLRRGGMLTLAAAAQEDPDDAAR